MTDRESRVRKKTPTTETVKTSQTVWYTFLLSLFFAFTAIYSGFRDAHLQFDLSLALEQEQFVHSKEDARIVATEAIQQPGEIGLPTLKELTAVPANFSCPKGTTIFENVVLPKDITHVGRKIPRVVHITARSRCVSKELRDHLSEWVFPDHSLYFHDDQAAYTLLDYAINDKHGHELVKGLSKSLLCISSGATMSDFWRLVLLYHYGGVYTDIDNSPGKKYSNDLIQSETDSFFFVEKVGILSQFFIASSRHHPFLLHSLNHCVKSLYNEENNVMRNNPAQNTGPKAVKMGLIHFLQAVNHTTDGYLPAGAYHGGIGSNLLSGLPWYNETQLDDGTNEYPKASQLLNRSVTIYGNKKDGRKYINRSGLSRREKARAWKKMNMTKYFTTRAEVPSINKISCPQHVERMKNLTADETSFYFERSKIVDLLPNYEFRKDDSHWFDINTNEKLIPWSTARKRAFEEEEEEEEEGVSDDAKKKKKKKKKEKKPTVPRKRNITSTSINWNATSTSQTTNATSTLIDSNVTVASRTTNAAFVSINSNATSTTTSQPTGPAT